MATHGYGLRRAHRLRLSKDFKRVGRGAKRLTTRSFVVLIAPSRPSSGSQSATLGLTVSRRVGGAVTRNRVKRRVREWFRHQRGNLDTVDVVVIARPQAAALTCAEVASELNEVMERG